MSLYFCDQVHVLSMTSLVGAVTPQQPTVTDLSGGFTLQIIAISLDLYLLSQCPVHIKGMSLQ